MIEKLAFLSYIASIYPIGTRFAARLIARQKRHTIAVRGKGYWSGDIWGPDRGVSIVTGYAAAIVWPVAIPAAIVLGQAAPTGRKIKQILTNNIDRHVEKIEGQEQTLGRLGPR